MIFELKEQYDSTYYMANCIQRIIIADVKPAFISTIASELMKTYTIMEKEGIVAAHYHLIELCHECEEGKYNFRKGKHVR